MVDRGSGQYQLLSGSKRFLRESYLAFYAGGTAEIQRSVIARFL